jgi:oligoendopeptidase F
MALCARPAFPSPWDSKDRGLGSKQRSERMNSDAAHANWDLSSYFPNFDGPEYRDYLDRLAGRLAKFEEEARNLGVLSGENMEAWIEMFLRNEKIVVEYSHLNSYVGCLAAADATNEAYKREQAKMASLGAAFRKANIPLLAAIRSASEESFKALVSSEPLQTARYHLERMGEEARRSMDPQSERLAADLAVDGISAWGRLYNDLAGNLDFELLWPDGRMEKVPMAQKASMMSDPDPRVRKAVLASSNRAWEKVQNVACACLNGITGTRLTLNRHRGVRDFLDMAMFDAGVQESTIETMWRVVERTGEIPRRYLRSKARIIGKPQLGFQDLACPLPIQDQGRFSWQEATTMVLDAFQSFYPGLAEFARSMLALRRVESEKRPGKRPGAFCTRSLKTRESRVFMTFGGSLGDVQTLAHELGHAFHGWAMRDLRPFSCEYPMTLAETASTFAEGILASALIADKSSGDLMKAQLLAARLDHAAVFLLDIHMRYLFEKALYTERASGELSVSRLKGLMLEAQQQCFGDVLAEDEMDPMFWASKLHFYMTSVNFYNFPYTFGYLLSEGLLALARKEGREFFGGYEDLLRMAGSYPTEEVVKRSMGIDLTADAFWQDAIESISDEVKQFEGLFNWTDKPLF